MSFTDDLAAARQAVRDATDRVAKAQAALVAAKAQLKQLEAMTVRGGPDVSAFQGDVDWAKVAGAHDFAFVRVSDGDVADDRYTPARVRAMRDAGLIVGVYCFARPASAANGRRDGALECAMNTYAAWHGGALRRGDLPLVYDIENDSIAGLDPDDVASHLLRWVRTYKYLRKHAPIIYTNTSTATALVPHLTDVERALLASCPLWLAAWDAEPVPPAPWKTWAFHQHTSKGRCAGIAGDVDLNRFNGSRSALEAILIH